VLARLARVAWADVLRYEAESAAPPEAAWALVARPHRWKEWAPHVRGAVGLGVPEVEEGRHGVARLFGALPVPAVVTDKVPGRSWTWRVGPVTLVHRVRPRADGTCVVGVDLSAAPALETVLALTYGPVVALLVERLARVAERTGAVAEPARLAAAS
jgi:hypothetical protein